MKAFPQQSYEEWDGTEVRGSQGMDLRDYFAAHAMQSSFIVMSTPEIVSAVPSPEAWVKEVATQAYDVADAMMKARDKND